MNNLGSYTLPDSYAIRRLREEDFAIDTRDKICLYEDLCTLVIFYNESPESKNMLSVFKRVAETTTSISFASCNLMLETGVGKAMSDVRIHQDHPFYWAASAPIPFVLIYRRGYPVAFYEGPPDVYILTNFALKIACNPDFHSRNFPFINKVKEEMWNLYRENNNKMYMSNPGNVNSVLPAVPAKRIREIIR